MAQENKHVAFSLPYAESQDYTSENILDMLANNEFFLLSTILPYAKRPMPKINGSESK